jgi:peptidoglycan/xylan/chitin deacetylase (PgdA/CDA1 family)
MSLASTGKSWIVALAKATISHEISRRGTLLELASRVPVPLSVVRSGSKVDCVVFVAHAVVEAVPPPHLAHIVRCKTAARFEADLRWLMRRYRFVDYFDVQASLERTHALPANAALLTFDDGFAEIHSIVRPLLRRMGIPALVFVTDSLLDNRVLSNDLKASLCLERLMSLDEAQRVVVLRSAGSSAFDESPSSDWPLRLLRLLVHDETLTGSLWSHFAIDESSYCRDVRPYLTSEQVTEMASEGFSFGGHATVHRLMQNLNLHELEEEIVQSCGTVARLTGEAVVPFAFPYSGQGIRREWLREIRRRHPSVGLFFDVNDLKREGSLVWHRINIENQDESVGTTIRRAYLRALW